MSLLSKLIGMLEYTLINTFKYMHTAPVSPGTCTPNAYKLMQLRDRLARLNSPCRDGPPPDIIRKKYEENKNVEASISNLFDQISQHYYESSETISQISRQTIANIQHQESLLLRQLDLLKEKQLDAIKEDVEVYLAYSRKIKKMMKGHPSKPSIHMEIKNIKPFQISDLHHKIDKFQPQAHRVDYLIDQYRQNCTAFTFRLESETYKKSTGPQQTLKSNYQLKLSDIARRNSDLSSFHEDYSRFFYRKTEDQGSFQSKKKSELQDDQNLITQTLQARNDFHRQSESEEDRKTEKEWKLSDHLMKKNKKRKHKKKASSIFDQIRQEAAKEISFPKKPENLKIKGPKVHNGNPAISSAARSFLYELRSQKRIHQEFEKAEKPSQPCLSPSIAMKESEKGMGHQKRQSHHRLSRVKSEEALIASNPQFELRRAVDDKYCGEMSEVYERRSKNCSEDIKFSGSSKQKYEKDKNLCSVRSADFSKLKVNIQLGLNNKSSGQKLNVGVRRGNWAQILKQQQTNYNEMRKRIKS